MFANKKVNTDAHNIRLALLGVLLLISPVSIASNCDSLSALNWMLGTWEARSGKQTTTESWINVSTHTFEGKGISFTDGQFKNEESLRILEMSGALYFLAKVNHNPVPVIFSLTHCTENSARFENLNHDFPKRIEYRYTEEGKLHAHVSDAGSKGFTIEFNPAQTPQPK